MPTFIPRLHPTMLIGDDPTLLAQISARSGKRGHFLPVLPFPRIKRPDWENEVTLCNNTAALAQPAQILLVRPDSDTARALSRRFPARLITVVDAFSELESKVPDLVRPRPNEPLVWGLSNIGVGLLKALRENRDILFVDGAVTTVEPSRLPAQHLVACEQGDEHAQVIAANYAFAIGADLFLLPHLSSREKDEISERFYGSADPGIHQEAVLTELKAQIRGFATDLPLPNGGVVTFITSGIPWGFAYPEVPSTHLFIYPRLGASITQAIACEQPAVRKMNVAMVVDPREKRSEDIETAATALAERGVFVRAYSANQATISTIRDALQWFPYDLLLIATHCGDMGGYRFTYEFKDSAGFDRVLVVDSAVNFDTTAGSDRVSVLEFMNFVSIDGIPWEDKQALTAHGIGTAISDFLSAGKSGEKPDPVAKENIPRVPGSSALKLYDGDFLSVNVALANTGFPVVFNNACGSWHRLAEDFYNANARAYLGTLFPINELEAVPVVQKMFVTHLDRPLALALWKTQNELYGEQIRRPYLMVGCHFQQIKPSSPVNKLKLLADLERTLKYVKSRLSKKNDNEVVSQRFGKVLEYLTFEYDALSSYVRKNILPKR